MFGPTLDINKFFGLQRRAEMSGDTSFCSSFAVFRLVLQEFDNNSQYFKRKHQMISNAWSSFLFMTMKILQQYLDLFVDTVLLNGNASG